jgi:AcrR family transcriptional regulator
VSKLHPTKVQLLETAVALIDEFGPQGFTVDALLEKSGISKGSLYHHFLDFSDVIEQAQVIRFSRYVDEDIRLLVTTLSVANSPDDLRQRFESIVLAASSPERANARSDRATIVGLARHSEKFAKSLSVEQQRVTDALADIAREAQEKGFIRKDVDVRVLATFLQAYTLGFVLNDVTVSPISSQEWASFVGATLSAAL